MKTNYARIKTFVVLLSTFALNAGAQLSGLYTINSASPTSGTNYQSFTDFATDINANGVSGPVEVNVAINSGPYVEQVLFNQVSGASSFNDITINGNGNLITFNSTSSSQRHVIGLNGTDWMRFNNLNMQGTGTYAYVCQLYGGADNNIFSSCTFSVPISATSSNMIPVVVSGSSTSYASSASSGNNNRWEDCGMFGGYACISFYGPSSGNRNGNNKVFNCNIADFYNYGIYSMYHWSNHFKGNTIERLTRTSVSTTYGIYGYYMQGAIIEQNKIQKLFNSAVNASSTSYCMYFYNYFSPAPTPGGSKNICRNNIVSDIKNNSTLYGMYAYYFDGDIYNNTISLDHTGATTGTTYGLYAYSQAGQEMDIYNNLITINRGGSGTKYGMYVSSPNFITADFNNIYIGSTSGTNYHGYYSGAQLTFAAWQAAGADAQGFNINPIYTNVLTDLHPTNSLMNNLANPVGLELDNENNVRNQSTPDLGALEFLTPNCSGTPSANGVSSPTYAICPGEEVHLGLTTLNPDAGFTYQWQMSTTSNVGPFTPINGATSLFYTAPSVTTTSWFSVVMTCTLPGGGSISPVGQVMVAGPTSSAIPYFEGFEGIGKTNRLPNCSWSASDLGSSNLTYTAGASNNRVAYNGSGFGGFSNGSPGTSYFYTNPIQMNTGITYSAALWYATEYFGYNNWSDLSIMVGPNQSTTGLVQVASVGPAMSGPYKLLDNTFTVPSSGLYYVAIRATSTSGQALYLSIDDLAITIPCGVGSPNSPTVSLNASTGTICAGQSVNLNANGANSYAWSNGATGQNITVFPTANTTYFVTGTNALTGCTSALSQLIVVNASPNIFVTATKSKVCAGQPTELTAYGATSYAWSNGAIGSAVIVSPNQTTSYTVAGVNALGCSTDYVIQIAVNKLPTVSVFSNSGSDVCKDDLFNLTASGALTYSWTNNVNSQVYQGTSIGITSPATAEFTVTGIDANGCSNIATIVQNVVACTGISEGNSIGVINLYPVPTSGELTIELNSAAEKTLEITDLTGRVLLSKKSEDIRVQMDIKQFANGVYYLKISSNNTVEVIKIVKQ